MPRISWLFVLLFYCTGLYAQPRHPEGKPYREKFEYVDSLGNALMDADAPQREARAKLMSTRSDNTTDVELKALLQLLAYKLLVSGNKPDTAGIEHGLETMLEECGNNRYIRADILQYMGKFYLDIRRRNSHAFDLYLMAYNEYRNLPPEDFPQKRNYIYDLAGAYYRYEDYPNAIKYMNEALATPSHIPFHLGLTMNNTIGLSFRELKQYDSAMVYFNRAYEKAKEENNAVWLGILSGNIGEIYYQQGEYSEAISKLEEGITLCLSQNLRRNAILATCRLAGIYLEQNNIAAAEQTLDRIEQIREGRPFWPEYAVAQRLFEVSARLHAAKGNGALAYKYADSALRAKDSAYAEQTEINRVRAAEKAEYVQDKLDLARIAQEKQRQYFIRNLLIVVIVLGALVGLLFINHQRLRHKKTAAELEALTNKLIALSPQTEKQETGAEHISEKEEEEEIDPETLSKLENATLLTSEQWDEFRKLFDKVHKGFLNNLRRKIPDLTPADIRFIALTKLRLSSREMASMLGVSPATIRIYKFRLRKKLGLEKEDDIEAFINKM